MKTALSTIPQSELDAVLARVAAIAETPSSSTLRKAVARDAMEACEGGVGQDELNALLAGKERAETDKKPALSAVERAILKKWPADRLVLYARDAFHIRDGMRAELSRHHDERVRVALMSRDDA